MPHRHSRFHIGLRTVKTVVSVILAMMVVESYGATTSRLIFAMLGAMAAVQPTFKESLEACISQIVGVVFGALAGLLLIQLPLHPLVATGIGMVLVITLYNALRIRFSPSLPCFIVVMLCVSPDIAPIEYALGRIWDSAIGLIIGMVINTLIFPYDNSRQIRSTAESLEREVIHFLEDLFDGDEVLPNEKKMIRKVDQIGMQLAIFRNQRLFLHLQRQEAELKSFETCEDKARELIARMVVLSQMGRPGRLSPENRNALELSGAMIQDDRKMEDPTEADIVTNYHVRQILRLRQELLEALGGIHVKRGGAR